MRYSALSGVVICLIFVCPTTAQQWSSPHGTYAPSHLWVAPGNNPYGDGLSTLKENPDAKQLQSHEKAVLPYSLQSHSDKVAPVPRFNAGPPQALNKYGNMRNSESTK